MQLTTSQPDATSKDSYDDRCYQLNSGSVGHSVYSRWFEAALAKPLPSALSIYLYYRLRCLRPMDRVQPTLRMQSVTTPRRLSPIQGNSAAQNSWIN